MAWKIFLSKKSRQPAAGQQLTVDLHSHLIPGVDDGARDEETCLALLQGMVALGYRKCITTPHCYAGIYDNNASTIHEGLQRVEQICTAHQLPLSVVAAAEYFFDNNFFVLLEKKQLLTFGNNHVLFELPMHNHPAMLEEVIFHLKLNGYQPVLAHPERYPYFHDKKIEALQIIREMGCLFQLNIMSLTGYYNTAIRKAARNLVKLEWVDFAGTDLHKQKHLETLQRAQGDKYFLRLLSSGKLLNNTL